MLRCGRSVCMTRESRWDGQMLVKGVERLTDHAERKEYKEAAEILEAVTSLFTHFKDYTAVQKARACASSARGCMSRVHRCPSSLPPSRG